MKGLWLVLLGLCVSLLLPSCSSSEDGTPGSDGAGGLEASAGFGGSETGGAFVAGGGNDESGGTPASGGDSFASGGVASGDGGSNPGTGGSLPGTGGEVSGSGGSEPGSGGREPGSGGSEPGSGGSDPGSGGSEPGGGGDPGSGGESSAAGGAGLGGSAGSPEGALGAYPVDPSTVTQGGTITVTNIGAPGWWPRRLDRDWGDPDCDYRDDTDTWGGHCCMTQHTTTSETLSPFDEEMTLILKAINVRQLAVYQPVDATAQSVWNRVSSWDRRQGVAQNLWFTQSGAGSTEFPGDLTGDDCVWYLMQEPVFECATADYFCPDDPGINHQGWLGSKLVVFLASMTFDDANVLACGSTEAGHPGPWVAFVASELIRDGGRKWNGLCNCYSATGSVGDGCGEINVFEVVMDDNEYSNRNFMSTGVRSFQEGHVGGSVCGASCDPNAYAPDVEVLDACAGQAYTTGPVVEAGGSSDGCPVWRRPAGDRYFMILLDERRRTIQVAIIHPENVPAAAAALLPELPIEVERSDIEGLIDLRLPS